MKYFTIDPKNMLAPLEFGDRSDADITLFIRDFRCGICLGQLEEVPIAGKWHRWNAKCRTHGLIIEGGYVHAGKARDIDQAVTMVGRELRPEQPHRTTEQILSELGF